LVERTFKTQERLIFITKYRNSSTEGITCPDRVEIFAQIESFLDPMRRQHDFLILMDNQMSSLSHLSQALSRVSSALPTVKYKLPGGPKKWYPGINFAITSVNVHRF